MDTVTVLIRMETLEYLHSLAKEGYYFLDNHRAVVACSIGGTVFLCILQDLEFKEILADVDFYKNIAAILLKLLNH